MTISDAAARFGVAPHVLRHWESMNLLRPTRIHGQRRYGRDDLSRIATIRLAKEVGLSLDQIASMINTTDAAARRQVLRRRQADLRASILTAERALAMITGALACGHDDFTSCPDYRAAISAELDSGSVSVGS